MSLFGPPNVAKLAAKKDLKGLIASLGYRKEVRVRVDSAQALGKLGPSAVEPLILALRDEDYWVRTSAANALGEIGDARAVEHLIAAPDLSAAAWALGEIGDARALQPLIVALKSSDTRVRMAAAGALGKIGDASAVEPLIAVFGDQDPRVGTAATIALAQIGPRAVEPLIAVLKGTDNAVRRAAAQALGELGDRQALEPLIACLGAQDGSTRRAAAQALDKLAWRADTTAARAAYLAAKGEWEQCVKIGEPAVEPLLTVLSAAVADNDEWDGGSIAWALGRIGDARAVEPLIAVFRDENRVLRGRAAEALGEIGDSRSIEPLFVALKDMKALNTYDPYLRDYIVDALRQIGAPAVDYLTAALSDRDEAVRTSAAEVLDKLAWTPDRSEAGAAYWVTRGAWDKCVDIGPPALGILVATLHTDVRRRAVEALGNLGDARAIESLAAVLKDPDARVRAAVASALGKIGDPRAVDPLIASLRDPDKDVRGESARALGQIGGARSLEALIVALRDPDKDLRVAAAEALGQIGDPRALDPLIVALEDRGGKAAADALDKLAWTPDHATAGGAYWAAKGEWGKCVEIGAPAIRPLIDVLSNSGAAEALLEIGAPAVEPLITTLGDDEWCKRGAAAKALGKLGDHRAVEPLIDLLNDPAPFVRKAAVQAPGTLGGAAAIESLVAALRHRNKDTRTAVADALDNLGWRPDNSEAGAEYWAVRGEWDECVKIGAPALEILIAAIESEAWGVRMAAAAAIVAIYQSGRLDEHQKARLLAQRGAITRAHADQRKSFTPSSDCTDHSDVHTDEGIGLDFLI